LRRYEALYEKTSYNFICAPYVGAYPTIFRFAKKPTRFEIFDIFQLVFPNFPENCNFSLDAPNDSPTLQLLATFTSDLSLPTYKQKSGKFHSEYLFGQNVLIFFIFFTF